jgi:hypothetical protein
MDELERMQVQKANWQVVNVTTPANYFHGREERERAEREREKRERRDCPSLVVTVRLLPAFICAPQCSVASSTATSASL